MPQIVHSSRWKIREGCMALCVYYLGVLSYIAKGAPQWELVSPRRRASPSNRAVEYCQICTNLCRFRTHLQSMEVDNFACRKREVIRNRLHALLLYYHEPNTDVVSYTQVFSRIALPYEVLRSFSSGPPWPPWPPLALLSTSYT